MAQFQPRFASPSQLQSKSQPRRLSHWDSAQQCRWRDCSATAVSEPKDPVYCASPLFRTLQQQWQAEGRSGTLRSLWRITAGRRTRRGENGYSA
jgi:hypothetical protein